MSIESVVNSYVDACKDAAEVRVLIQEAIAESQPKIDEPENKTSETGTAETGEKPVTDADETTEAKVEKPEKEEEVTIIDAEASGKRASDEEEEGRRPSKMQRYETRLTQLESRVDMLVQRMDLYSDAFRQLAESMKETYKQNEEWLKEQNAKYKKIFKD